MSLVHSKEITYERLPMLEIVFDRLERMLTTSVRNFTSDNVDISLENITAQRFGDYLNSVPLPAMISVFKAVEWDNYGLITVDSPMIYSIVDVLLGGRRGTVPMRIEGRPYTTIEARLIERLIRLVLDDLGQAFAPVTAVQFRFERMETNPRFAAIARPGNACVVFKLRIDLEDRGGTIEFLIPYATLEPARDLLLQMFMGEKFGRDSIWESHLAREIWHTDLELEAVLEEQTLSLGVVLDLKVGSAIPLSARPDTPVQLRCGEIPMLIGRAGGRGDRIIVQVDGRLDRAEEAPP
jgi:flagellar motor switch protein FliM